MAAPGYLLDTNVLLQLVRGNDLGQRIDQRYHLRRSMTQCIICVVTIGEAKSLVIQLGWGEAKRTELESLLSQVTSVDISDPLLLDAYAVLDAHSRSVGRRMGKNDVWIAAVANVTGMTLLTTDKDFDHLDPDYLRRNWIDPDTKGNAT